MPRREVAEPLGCPLQVRGPEGENAPFDWPVVGGHSGELAATVTNNEFLSWQLYWRALFDVRMPSAQDVNDPNGLVQSQAIQNASGSFRITLNSTDARGALSARFLSQSFDAAYQQVALRVADMEFAAAALAANRLEQMPVPANYYDDAAPNFGLSTEEAVRLAAQNVLIDEDDEGGRFRQIYSRAFARTFFFEFVERRGGYDGYGAPNLTHRYVWLPRTAFVQSTAKRLVGDHDPLNTAECEDVCERFQQRHQGYKAERVEEASGFRDDRANYEGSDDSGQISRQIKYPARHAQHPLQRDIGYQRPARARRSPAQSGRGS